MKIVTKTDLERAYLFALDLMKAGPVDWECKRWRKSRSNEQNALQPSRSTRLPLWRCAA